MTREAKVLKHSFFYGSLLGSAAGFAFLLGCGATPVDAAIDVLIGVACANGLSYLLRRSNS